MMKSEKLKSTRNGVEAFSRLACSNERQSRALLFCVLAAEKGEGRFIVSLTRFDHVVVTFVCGNSFRHCYLRNLLVSFGFKGKFLYLCT